MPIVDKYFSIPTVLQRGVDLYPELTRRWRNLQDYLQQVVQFHTHTGGTDGAVLIGSDQDTDTRTFTNTSFLDLDALTGGSGTLTALSIPVTTKSKAFIGFAAQMDNTNAGSFVVVSYKVSGATTSAASDTRALVFTSVGADDVGAMSWGHVRDDLTSGTNTFELQARVDANTGSLGRVYMWVQAV